MSTGFWGGRGHYFYSMFSCLVSACKFIIKYIYKNWGHIKLIKMNFGVAFPRDLPLKYSAVV